MTVTAQISDFPDRLSPMVVKELRQGLRTRLFGGVMLVLHVLLVLITLITGAAANPGDVTGLMDGLVYLVMMVIFPLTGFSALAGEFKANTMDMLYLSRLSIGRIVFGKWASVVLQSGLVAVSILPYEVARYLYGGSELVQEVMGLFYLWLSSAVVTAAVVALSTQKQFWLRGVIIALPLMMVFFSSLSWAFMGVMGNAMMAGGLAQMSVWVHLTWVAASAWFIFACLSFGASRVAPAASLLPVMKRLVNLVALLGLAALEWLGSDTRDASNLAVVVFVVASLDALTDDTPFVPTVYLPFYRRGLLGRVAGLFLAPGWMHGLLYSLLLFCATAGIVWYTRDWEKVADIWMAACCLWGSVFFAQLLAIRRRDSYVGATLAGAAVMSLLAAVGGLMHSAPQIEAKWGAFLTPVNTMVIRPAVSDGLRYGVHAVWPVLLLLLAWRAFRLTRPVRQQAAHLASLA